LKKTHCKKLIAKYSFQKNVLKILFKNISIIFQQNLFN